MIRFFSYKGFVDFNIMSRVFNVLYLVMFVQYGFMFNDVVFVRI